MLNLPPPLEPMAQYPQFINYILVPREDGKTDKIPVGSSGTAIDPTDVTYHKSFEEALSLSPNVGFVFTPNDPFFFIDLDDCLEDSGWSDAANRICASFEGCAIEVSNSGKGLHIFGVAPITLEHSCRCDDIGSDFYTESRFVALTGTNCIGTAGRIPDATIYQEFISTYFPPKQHVVEDAWTDAPVPEWNGPKDDAKLIAKMRKSKSAAAAFGGKAPLVALLDLNDLVLSQFYPDPNRPFDYSAVEAALCQHLAFWTGKDCGRMERIMSELPWVRSKWLDREPYRRATILGAVSLCENVYSKPKPASPGDAPGHIFLTPEDQIEYFKDLVYVRDMHQVLTPDGTLITPEKFRTTYSKGRIFCLDNLNDKVTKNAWTAFTESQVNEFKMAYGVCFRPELPPMSVVAEEGYTYVNTYTPANVDTRPGDVAPFLTQLNNLIPDPNDRMILLSYMAACVQYPGVKFQWCPLLQGVPGNGKTFLASCVKRAVGNRYTHMPNSQDLDNKFNDWLARKLFIIIEDIYAGGKSSIMEALKPMITNTEIEFQPKRHNQYTGDNRANFFMCSNYKDGVKKTQHDRRIAVFFTAQQHAHDLDKYGMSGTYFPNLYKWAREDGYAFVSHYLKTFPIPNSMNPATDCQRAPMTSSTTEAILASMGPVEQELLEVIAECRPGFSGGWISSVAFTNLVKDRFKISTNRRHEIMTDINYIPHPNLPGGRLSTPVWQEGGGKPRLYIKEGHLNQNLERPADIREAYMKAQEYATNEEGPSIIVNAMKGGA